MVAGSRRDRGKKRPLKENIFQRGSLVVLLLVIVGAAIFFPRAGAFLVAEDNFVHADIALVLSGLPVSRSFAARDLYGEGRVGRVYVVPEPPNKLEGELITHHVREELTRLKLFDPKLPEWSERILIAAGVPKEKITVLPTYANGTIVEARLVRAFFERVGFPKSMAVITSKSASRRARLIFRRVFKKDSVQIFSYPTPYDRFESNRWWSNPRNALITVMEYEKMLVNAVALMFSSYEGRWQPAAWRPVEERFPGMRLQPRSRMRGC